MSSDKRERLAEKAIRLKKAYLCLVAILGKEFKKLTEADLVIPRLDNKRLQQYTEDLEDDIDLFAQVALLDWKRSNSNLSRAVDWLASAYDAWGRAGFGLFDLRRVHEIERSLGRLGFRREKECPPYAQVLLQGWYGAAIRHPEYHLAQDLALLCNLFLDSEALIEDAKLHNIECSTEHSQSLARNVILTCFNLLESFANGLGFWTCPRPEGLRPEWLDVHHSYFPHGLVQRR